MNSQIAGHDVDPLDLFIVRRALATALRALAAAWDMLVSELVAQFLANAGPKPWHLDRLKVLLPFFADYCPPQKVRLGY
jgi:hypothetical protein